MTCQPTENISLLIDGELPAEESLRLERHLLDCRECQEARSDFLNLRSQIVAFNPGVDRAASQVALAEVLGRIQVPKAIPARSAGLGLFGALRFKPAFAAVALILVGSVVGLLIYRNQPKPGESLASEQNTRQTPSPAATPTATPSPSTANTEGVTKPNESKRPKEKSQPPIDVPKVRKAPDDVISPWRNQAIAVNAATETGSPAPDIAEGLSAQVESLTARHLGQSELLLRSFRNVRSAGAGLRVEVGYERSRAQKLVYQNILLRREADAKGDVQVATLLDSLEPILLDIANLPERPLDEDVQAIKERLQRQNLVALLQVNSTVLARANE